MTKQIRFNAFEMNCVTHQSPGLWRHPRDRSWQYKDIEYWTDLAKILEKGIFDGIFIADVLGTYDVYHQSNHHALQGAVQVPVNDPLQLAPAMATVTQHLGFGITTSISFEHPYPFARRMSTLDHLTKGRAGWNIVTSYLSSGAKNIGQTDQLLHDDRYEIADEYLEVLYSFGKVVGRMMPLYVMPSLEFLSTPKKFSQFSIMVSIFKYQVFTSVNLHLNVPQYSTKQAHHLVVNNLQPNMLNVFLFLYPQKAY